jgi:hypothetical protein
MWGDVSAKMADEMRKEEVKDFFCRAIQRVCPKSYAQVMRRSIEPLIAVRRAGLQ